MMSLCLLRLALLLFCCYYPLLCTSLSGRQISRCSVTSSHRSLTVTALPPTLDEAYSYLSDRKSDFGLSLGPAERSRIDQFIDSTIDSKVYTESKEEASLDERVFGNYIVSYSSDGRNQSQGSAAGGNFRGNALFRITGLYQHILRANPGDSDRRSIVVNYISGQFLFFFALSVILKGRVEILASADRRRLEKMYGNRLSPSTVKASFDPPLLAIASRALPDSPLVISIGPRSSVDLDTPYLDDRIRIGVGARGSRFLFTRTTEPASDAYKAILERSRRPITARFLGALLATGGLVALRGLRRSLYIGASLIVVGLLLAISRGGIERDDKS